MDENLRYSCDPPPERKKEFLTKEVPFFAKKLKKKIDRSRERDIQSPGRGPEYAQIISIQGSKYSACYPCANLKNEP